MNKKVFSLVIQDDYLKVLTLKRNKVKSFGLTKTSPGTVMADKPVRIQRVSEELFNLLKSTQPKKIRVKDVVLGIPDSYTFIKYVKFPGIKKEEIPETLKWQLEKILPLPSHQLYWDYTLIKEDRQGVEILIIAVNREIVDAYVNILEILGYNLWALEPYSLSLAKLLSTDHKPLLIINLSRRMFTLIVAKNGLPLFSTVQQIDLKGPSLLKTIQQSIDFYQKEQKEEIKNVVICGEKEVDSVYLLAKKNLPRLHIEKLQLEIAGPYTFKRYSPRFLINIGLLIKESGFNLLPEELKEKRVITRINKLINRLALYYILFILLIIAAFLGAWLKLTIDLKITQAELKTLAQTKSGVDLNLLINKVNSVNQKAQKIKELFSLPSYHTADLLKNINNAAPSNLRIEGVDLNYYKKTITITGWANSREQIILFKQNLEKINQIASINLPLSNLEKPTDINFTLNGQLK